MATAKKKVQEMLGLAGITINGPNGFDVQVHNEKVYSRILSGGTLALGESYMDGWWDVKDLDQFFDKVLSAHLEKQFSFSFRNVALVVKSVLINPQSMWRAFAVGQQHYDIGNDLYSAMLDKRLVYTCAYWKDATALDQAQAAKLDLVCRKLGLKKGDRVLDIGCGWGSFLKFAAEKYGIEGVGATVSKEQAELARQSCQGLPVEIVLEDYRNIQGQFDYIVSLGMFEHVGQKNYQTYMKKVHELLKDGGLFLLHTIGNNHSVVANEPWMEKYIFPNGMLPSVAQIGKSIEKYFVMEDWHNFGAYYDKTLMAWFENFDKAYQSGKLQGYSERFYRMWRYYLLSCAGGFRSRSIQLWQIVLSKGGAPGGYQSVR